MVRGFGDHQFARAVEVQTRVAVAVDHPGLADHERRVRDDLIEGAARDRLEPRTLEDLEVESVQCRGGRGQVGRPRVDVGCRHRARIVRRAQRLDAASGADVEHGADRTGGGALQQGQGRVTHTDHVVVGGGASPHRAVEVGQHPPVAGAQIQRAQIEFGPHGVAVTRQQAGGDGVVDVERTQRGRDVGDVAVVTEQEQSNEKTEIAADRGRAADRYRLVPVQGGVGLRAQEVENRVGVELAARERLAKGAAHGQQEITGHASIVAAGRSRPVGRASQPSMVRSFRDSIARDELRLSYRLGSSFERGGRSFAMRTAIHGSGIDSAMMPTEIQALPNAPYASAARMSAGIRTT